MGLLRHVCPARDHDYRHHAQPLDLEQLAGVGGVRVDDFRKTYEDLSGKGVTFLQGPADRPYGVEAVMRDDAGTCMALIEPKDEIPSDA